MKKSEKTVDHPILVVDDNPVVTRLMANMLDHAGYTVVEAGSGYEALVWLETLCPALILLDIDMPGLSGIETCRIIKKGRRTAEIPVLFVTVSNSKDDIVAGFAAGGQDYIVKPSTKEELLARVRTHLALCKTQQELKTSRARYRKLSFLDDLTGLYNTRYLYQTLQRYLDRYPQRSIAASFLDIDSFKQVVDHHGHLNGSRAIAELAGIIKSLLPRGCYGVSYGGDEFVLVLPGYDAHSAGRLVRKIREAIAASRFLTVYNLDIGLTVSCGVAAYPENAHNLVDLLGMADQSLFEAKRQGKNRMVSYVEMQGDGEDREHFLPVDHRCSSLSMHCSALDAGLASAPAAPADEEELPHAGLLPRQDH
ncbi:MAG: diguanylate cyclase [Desulfobulbus sp.]|nr:diguanylate cyclase [Desulfobulbus sp.]